MQISDCKALCIAVVLLGGRVARADDAPKPRQIEPVNEESYREVLNAARDPNRDVRSLVAWELARLGRGSSLDALTALAADPAPEVRAAALRAMGSILPPKSRVKVTLEVPVADAALRLEALAAARRLFFDQRSDLLKAALKSADAPERELALAALELDPPADSRPALLAALKDPEPVVRAAAARAFTEGDASVVLELRPLVKEQTSAKSYAVRAAACEALARIHAAPTPAELSAAVTDTHFLVRRAAIGALAQLKDTASVPAIQGRLGDADFTVRETACRALGELIAPASAPLLVERLRDGVVEVRAAAEAALKKFPPDMAYAAVVKFVDYQEARAIPSGEDRDARRRAWRVLGEFAHPSTREMAFGHLNAVDVEVRACAWRVLRKLKDERVIAPAMTLLTGMVIGSPAPPDPLGEEAYEVAITFQRPEPVKATLFMLNFVLHPPAMETPPPFAPSAGLALSGAHYLFALRRTEAIPLLEEYFQGRRPDVPGGHGREIAQWLDEVTGKPHPLTPLPPERITFFINAHKSEKAP